MLRSSLEMRGSRCTEVGHQCAQLLLGDLATLELRYALDFALRHGGEARRAEAISSKAITAHGAEPQTNGFCKLPQMAGNPHEIDERSCGVRRQASGGFSAPFAGHFDAPSFIIEIMTRHLISTKHTHQQSHTTHTHTADTSGLRSLFSLHGPELPAVSK